jgi:hypothetical protein
MRNDLSASNSNVLKQARSIITLKHHWMGTTWLPALVVGCFRQYYVRMLSGTIFIDSLQLVEEGHYVTSC